MSELTLDEAIKHCLEVAEQNEISAITYKNCKEIKTNAYEKLTAEKAECDCRECASDHRQLAEWLTELKEAKRLLKVAVEDFSNIYDHIFDCDGMCDTCPIHGNRDTCDKWVHADEAEKLLNNEKINNVE